jgi:predicted nucleic acid-binding protein
MISIPDTKVFCDTSFFYASIDPKDENHDKAKEITKALDKNNIALYCTKAIIFETITLLRYRFSYDVALKFIKEVKPKLNIVQFDENLYSRVDFWFEKLSKDKKLSYCDIISYVAVREILGDISCVSFDHDFKTLGLNMLSF